MWKQFLLMREAQAKWQLYLMPEEKVLAKGLLERIGLKVHFNSEIWRSVRGSRFLILKITRRRKNFAGWFETL